MFERFTERARQVIVLSQEAARELKHNYIGTEHFLIGLLREEEGIAARVLKKLGFTDDQVMSQIQRIIGEGEEATSGQIPFTPRSKKIIEMALREALSLGHNYIGTEHLLLAFVRENEGVGARIISELGADRGVDSLTIREAVNVALAGTPKWREYDRLRKKADTTAEELNRLTNKSWGYSVTDDQYATFSDTHVWENRPVRNFEHGLLVLSGLDDEPVVYISISSGSKVTILKGVTLDASAKEEDEQ